ncbi:MAG: glycoside hydrolase [Verrucomicrobiota bacterium]|nr:glycoside hydrolase [Verrucomicrobiota bacterium]
MKKNSFVLRVGLPFCTGIFFGLNMQAAPVPTMQEPDRSQWPAALRTIPLERLSSGALSLLDRGGDLVRPAPATTAAAEIEAVAEVTLDLRVAPNLRLGDDPTPLPPTMRAQAEPHIARSPVDPNLLVATFQEGRFTDGGAVDCGYSVTQDGGLTWTRALIPNLTTVTGGPYFRATDPVAGIDLSGRIFLNTEGATNSDFTEGVIVVSRSLDGGITFEAPTTVFRPSNSNDFPDKSWMALNTFPGTSTVGRIVVTWTLFGMSDASPIMRAYSNDNGLTWSAATAIHNANLSTQGSQPVFLPDGRLAVIYWNFNGSSGGEQIEMVLSNDGGLTFGAPTLVTPVARYAQPSIRTGIFLPSATTDRTTGTLYVVYQGRDATPAFHPRVFFTKSSNAGATWATPIAITDNLSSGVFNPAISASPDGQTLTVSFYDQRDSGGDTTLCNLYLAQSFDGGVTWGPNIRLTSETTNAALAPLTPGGYMLGDYLGIAPSTSPDVPAVPVWVDTRTGNPDPFISRVGIAPNVDFTSFQAARLSLDQINDPQLGGPEGDADDDAEDNLSEFLSRTDPTDAASVVHTSRQLNISTRENVGTGDNVLIAGLIIAGPTPKKVILRGIGPSLASAGLSGVLADPTLELRDDTGSLIFSNDNWRETQEQEVIDTTVPPTDDLEAAIVATLDPGAYTVLLQGSNGGVGTGLVEAYDLDTGLASQFANISSRGQVGAENEVLIGGLIVSSEAGGQVNEVVRALGPSLGGVAGALQDPTLELYDREGNLIALNDNWRDTQEGIINSVGLAPDDDREAAIFSSLVAGAYTAVVRGVNATTGVGLVEAYSIR